MHVAVALAFAEQENILSIDGSFFFILILFIVLVIVANKLIYKPILQVLDKRDKLTVGASGEAASIIDDYNKRLAHYENTIRQAKADSYRDLENGRKEALGKRAEIIDATKAQIGTQIDSAKAGLLGQANQAKQDLNRDAQAIASQISSTILKRPVGGTTR
jgi:F-type H+-transporting ATPase subunit b